MKTVKKSGINHNWRRWDDSEIYRTQNTAPEKGMNWKHGLLTHNETQSWHGTTKWHYWSIPIVKVFESVPWLYSTLWFRVCCVYGLKYNLAIRLTNKNATLILKLSAESQHFNRNPPYLCGSHRLPSCHGQATHSPIGREEQKMLKGCSPVDAGPHQKNGSYI